jgi:hypothetical protein
MKSTVLALAACALATAFLGTAARADEILYFTNGTSMPVISHEVDGETIRVMLNGDSSMTFSMDQVDRIEDAKGAVVSSHKSFNQAVPARPDGGTQSGSAPSRFKRGQWESPDVANDRNTQVETDERGLAVTRPNGNSSNAAQRKMASAGSRSIFNQPPITSRRDGIIGTTRMGNKNVIPKPGMIKPTPTGIQQRADGGKR